MLGMGEGGESAAPISDLQRMGWGAEQFGRQPMPEMRTLDFMQGMLGGGNMDVFGSQPADTFDLFAAPRPQPMRPMAPPAMAPFGNGALGTLAPALQQQQQGQQQMAQMLQAILRGGGGMRPQPPGMLDPETQRRQAMIGQLMGQF